MQIPFRHQPLSESLNANKSYKDYKNKFEPINKEKFKYWPTIKQEPFIFYKNYMSSPQQN